MNKEQFKAKMREEARDQIYDNIIKQIEKEVKLEAGKEVARYIKSKEFKKDVGGALRESVRELLFDDTDWIPWDALQKAAVKRFIRLK